MRKTNRSHSHLLHAIGAVAALAAAAALAPLQSASAYTEKVLYTFCSQTSCTDGSGPSGRLLMDGAGNLFGATGRGGIIQGDNTGGVLFELVKNGSSYDYKVLYSFCAQTNCTDGEGPTGHLIMDVKGNLYGTTSKGGTHGGGTVFELTQNRRHTRWKLRTRYNFCAMANCADGANPYDDGLTYQGAESGALYDGAAPLYGTTYEGGDMGSGTGAGVAFKLTGAKHNKYSVIYRFCSQTNCTDGAWPWELIIDPSGNLFGQTYGNGGVVFELSPNGAGFSESVLYTFCQLPNCADGADPEGALTLTSNGLLGTAEFGGQCEYGLLYSLTSGGGTWHESATSSFCDTNGAQPTGKVLINGDLFGVAAAGGNSQDAGTVWTQSGEILSVLYTFCSQTNCTDGAYPTDGVVADASGNLFGITAEGGAAQEGVVFELSP